MSTKRQTISDQIKNWLANHHPSGFLLAAQLLQMILYAIFNDPTSQWQLLNVLGALILILVVWVIRQSPAIDWIAWVLAAPAFLLLIFSIILDQPALIVWSSILEALLYFYAAGSLIVYMLSDTNVTTDELLAIGATFTLFAWGFAHSYYVCQALVPESFINGGHPGQTLTFIELLFLSFTNLSATGLGDILPISAPARVLVMLEQFSGVGYIAIVVSRLIGLTTNKQNKKRH